MHSRLEGWGGGGNDDGGGGGGGGGNHHDVDVDDVKCEAKTIQRPLTLQPAKSSELCCRSIQAILKRHVQHLSHQAAGTRGEHHNSESILFTTQQQQQQRLSIKLPPGWAAVPWGRGRWGAGGTFSWTTERQDRGAAMLLQVGGCTTRDGYPSS